MEKSGEEKWWRGLMNKSSSVSGSLMWRQRSATLNTPTGHATFARGQLRAFVMEGQRKKKKNTARGVQYLMSAEGKQTLNTKNVTFYSPQTENKTCENREIPMPRKRNKHNKGLREIKSNQNPQDGPCPWTCDGSGTKTDGYSPKKNDKPVLIR